MQRVPVASDRLDGDARAVSLRESAHAETSTNLALDKVGRAYLALPSETAHPDEFSEVQRKIRTFVEDNFRIIEETSRSETLTAGTLEDVNLLANSVLAEVENRIATTIRPSRHARHQIII
jgi:hypothetical protein